MRPTVLFCLLVFSGSLKLHVQCEKIICGNDQYTVTNGSFSYCLNCDTCHPGYGLYPVCGQSVTYPPNGIGCKRCPNETFSDKLDSAPCYRCQQCAKLEIVTSPCTRTSDRICSGTCEKGYFFAKKVPHICQQCSYCCFDGKDEEQPECIKQGLNATGRHCSARLDKQCGPPPSSSTTAVTTQGTAVTHLPSTTHSPSHLTSHEVGKHPAIIALSILGGLFLAALVAILYTCKRKSQIWRRFKRTESTPPDVQNGNVTDRSPGTSQGNHNNASQVPQSVVYYTDPKVKALQNTGYAASSASATPEVSPSATPQQTDDEVDDLPDVVAVRNKRFLKRRSSKETQSNDPNVQAANEGYNYKGQDSKGGGQATSRRSSLEALKRKFSLPREKDDYQPLGQEDPDEPQGDSADAGSGRWKRSPSTSSFTSLKNKFVTKKDEPLVPNEEEDTDGSQGAITIIEEPSSQEVKEGSKVELVFNSKARGNSKLSYQWFKDGTKLPGKNESTLLLKSVTLPDFGWYKCAASCKDSPSDVVDSFHAELDVTPRDGTIYKCLSDIKDPNTQDQIGTLLTLSRHGCGGWRQVAFKYDMDQLSITSLEDNRDAGKRTLEYLQSRHPNLTVYDFCKTLKEHNIKRLDIVKELLGHLSVPSSSNVYV